MKDSLQTVTEISLALNCRNAKNTSLPTVVFITDQAAVSDPETVIRSLPAGAGVIFRDYEHSERGKLGFRLRQVCKEGEIVFLVARDPELATRLQADGLHLPEGLISRLPGLKKSHPQWIFTAAAHSKDALRRAEQAGADAALISPVFASKSHPKTFKDGGLVLGVEGFDNMCNQTGLPLYALGGIIRNTAPALASSGAVGLAAIRGFEG